MFPADQHPHLILLSADELDRDPFPDEPFRMTFPGYGTVGGVRKRADIAVRLNSADLVVLEAQIRAAKLALASRMLRKTPEEIEDEHRRAAAAALAVDDTPPTELLEIVLARLRVA